MRWLAVLCLAALLAAGCAQPSGTTSSPASTTSGGAATAIVTGPDANGTDSFWVLQVSGWVGDIQASQVHQSTHTSAPSTAPCEAPAPDTRIDVDGRKLTVPSDVPAADLGGMRVLVWRTADTRTAFECPVMTSFEAWAQGNLTLPLPRRAPAIVPLEASSDGVAVNGTLHAGGTQWNMAVDYEAEGTRYRGTLTFSLLGPWSRAGIDVQPRPSGSGMPSQTAGYWQSAL